MEINITTDKAGGTAKAYEQDVQIGQVEFVFEPGILSIDHTRVFKGHEGKGVAGAMIQYVTDYALENKLRIKPVCKYAVAWYQRHLQYENIIISQ